jgi:uncharacterized protein YecE (DUF72 family)
MKEETVEINTDTNWRGEAAPPTRSRIWIVLLLLLLLCAIGACGVLGYFWSQDKSALLTQEGDLQVLREELVIAKNSMADVTSQLEDQRLENQRIRGDWDKQVAQLKKEHHDTMQATYAQMDNIVHDSRKTLEYIARVERKLKEGQQLSKEESQQLMAIGNGLTFLHKQYEKPIEEFRELEKFLTDQLNVASVVPPTQRGAFFKRMLSKDYREHEQEYFRDQGKRAAFERSRAKVTEAYARAQAQMKQLSVQSGEYLQQLQAVVDSNDAQASDIDAFFNQSKEILQIHDRIMSLEPDSGAPELRP